MNSLKHMIRYIYLVTVIKKVFLSLFTSLVKGTMMSTKTFTSHLLIKVENLQKKLLAPRKKWNLNRLINTLETPPIWEINQ